MDYKSAAVLHAKMATAKNFASFVLNLLFVLTAKAGKLLI